MQGSGVSTNNKIILAGLPWSVLVVVTLWASDPEARSLVVIFAVVILALGWMAVASLLCRSPEDRFRYDREIIEHSSEAIARVSAEFLTQLGEVRSEVRRAQDIFSEAVVQLIGSFQDVNMHALRLRQLGGQTVGDGEAGSVDKFERNLIAEQVEQAVNKAVLSLQFQDVVTQLLGHVGRRLDVLDEVVCDELRLAEVLRDSGDPETTLQTLDALRKHVDQLAQKLVTLKKGVDNNPVSQTGYAGGDVELF